MYMAYSVSKITEYKAERLVLDSVKNLAYTH